MLKRVHWEVLQRIQERAGELSKRQRQVADYVARDLQRLAFSSAAAIAAEAGVSEATVTRLAYTLGYSGFAEMQAAVRSEANRRLESVGLVRRRAVAAEYRAGENLLAQVAERHRRQVADTVAGIAPADLLAAAARIQGAERVLVAGHHWSRSLATLLVDLLRSVAVNAMPLGGQEEREWQLAQTDQRALLVVIGFPRYVAETVAAAQVAKERGLPVLAITDAVTSPLAALADLVLPVPGTPAVPGSDYFAGAVALIDALHIAVSAAAPHLGPDRPGPLERPDEGRIRSLQESYRQFQTFIEEA